MAANAGASDAAITAIGQLFRLADGDGSGGLDRAEVAGVMKQLIRAEPTPTQVLYCVYFLIYIYIYVYILSMSKCYALTAVPTGGRVHGHARQ
jgi:hypothetical protein